MESSLHYSETYSGR